MQHDFVPRQRPNLVGSRELIEIILMPLALSSGLAFGFELQKKNMDNLEYLIGQGSEKIREKQSVERNKIKKEEMLEEVG